MASDRPGAAPEFRDRRGQQRIGHDWHGFAPEDSPDEREQMERAEGQKENDPDHAGPTSEQWIEWQEAPGDEPGDGDAKSRRGQSKQPFDKKGLGRTASAGEEGLFVHAWPGPKRSPGP